MASRRPVGAKKPWVRNARYERVLPHGLPGVAHCHATRSTEMPTDASTNVPVTDTANSRHSVR